MVSSVNPRMAFAVGALVSVIFASGIAGMSAVQSIAAVEPREQNSASLTLRVAADGCGELSVGSAIRLGGPFVLTARHVVEDATTIMLSNDGGYIGDASLVAFEGEGRDVALLSVDDHVDRTRTASIGSGVEAVTLAGHPRGGLLDVVSTTALEVDAATFGIVGRRLLSVHADARPGMSGGPILDDAGNLIGIIVGRDEASEIGLAIPIDELGDLIHGRGERATQSCQG